MNSLRMSFWMVPSSNLRSTPCSSPATMKKARIGITAPFIVIDTDIWSSGMPSNNIFISSTLSIATTAFTTSDGARVMIVALTPKQWSALVKVGGIADPVRELEARLGTQHGEARAAHLPRDALAHHT